MGKDYTLALPSHFQYPKPKKGDTVRNKPVNGPGENVIQFILSYNAALFTCHSADGTLYTILMN
ncbi:MAG: hypothetical protein AB9842_08875 [Bacteroidales bacterium]